MQAVRQQKLDAGVITALIKGGADVNAADKDGETALIKAVKASKPDVKVIEALLKNGANAKAQDKRKRSVLEFARKNKDLAGTDVLKHLEAVGK